METKCKKKIKRVEIAQNMMVRIIQELMPGSAGSACRGMLGVWDILSEIDKRKLFFLGMSRGHQSIKLCSTDG